MASQPIPAPDEDGSGDRRPSDSLRDILRRRTHAAHEQVDGGFARFDLTDRRDYRDFLSLHAQVIPGLEAALDTGGAGEILSDWRERRRTAALACDLADLLAPFPEAAPAPLFADRAEVLGGLYVLEGSRLGGAMLARRARSAHDPVVRTATRYLGHGEGRRFWPSFVACLNDADADPAAAVRGAIRTFALFDAALAHDA